MNQTANYQLCQWDPTDRILMEDFNSDNSKIDAALAGLAGQISAVSAGMGNCEMEVLTYTGAGGAEPRKITFSQVPDVFLVAGNLAFIMGQGGKATAILTCKDATYSESFVNDVDVAWSGSQLTLTNTVNARYQMDTKNKPYWVLGRKKKGCTQNTPGPKPGGFPLLWGNVYCLDYLLRRAVRLPQTRRYCWLPEMPLMGVKP